ncbi:hypothetical protein LguiA_000351 [Lonicera macranthoides]
MTCTEMAFFPTNFMLHNPSTTTHHHEDHHDHHQSPASLPHILPQDFHGVASFLGKKSSSMSFSGIDMCEEGNGNNNMHNNNNNNSNGELDEYSDDGSQPGEKKRRLNMEQVRTLEKNFELGNKLEPERKMQLARALGLQPRQIAIWFQNRRARWKTKQLEKDYDVLKRQFDAIKAENDALQAHNQKLHAEIMALKNREPTESINLNIKETEGSCSNRSENSSDIKLDISRTAPIESPSLSIHPPTTTSRPFFTSSIRPTSNGNVAQLININTSSRPEQLQSHKIISSNDQTTNVKEESYSNMFCGIDDQTAFWPWLEQQHFN